jgi:hypothetical protein
MEGTMENMEIDGGVFKDRLRKFFNSGAKADSLSDTNSTEEKGGEHTSVGIHPTLVHIVWCSMAG